MADGPADTWYVHLCLVKRHCWQWRAVLEDEGPHEEQQRTVGEAEEVRVSAGEIKAGNGNRWRRQGQGSYPKMVFKTELSSKGVTFCFHLQCSSRFLHVKPFVPLQRPTLRRTTTRQPSLLTLATIPISCYFALLLFQHLLSHGELPHAQCCVYAAADKGGRPPNGSWLMVANDQTLKKMQRDR